LKKFEEKELTGNAAADVIPFAIPGVESQKLVSVKTAAPLSPKEAIVNTNNLAETEVFEHVDNPEVTLVWNPTEEQIQNMTLKAINAHSLMRIDTVVELDEQCFYRLEFIFSGNIISPPRCKNAMTFSQMEECMDVSQVTFEMPYKMRYFFMGFSTVE
jgi:hypothetical protein